MDLDEDILGLLLVRVSELRSKVANCIARENSAVGEARSQEQLMSNGEDESSNASGEGDEEIENLLSICEAFDSLECQLGSLQAGGFDKLLLDPEKIQKLKDEYDSAQHSL